MASTYSTLKIELIGTGEQAGLWGTTTNTNLGTAIEEAIVGSADVTFSSADVTLTLTDTNATQIARHLRLNLTGTSGGARNLILGSGCQIEKPYLINNGLADTVTVKNTAGAGIAVPAGKTMWVYNNGTNVVDAITHLSSLTLGTVLASTSGGTGNAFFTVSGPASSVKTYTFPNENMTVVGTTQTQTLTNKTITQRVSSTASISSPLAFNSDNFDLYAATAQAGNLTINADAGNPTDGQKIIFRFTCDGTIRTITFTGGATKGFKPVGANLTVAGSNFTYALSASKTTYFGCVYNTSSSRWEVVALSQEA